MAVLMDSSRTEDPGTHGTHLRARTPAHAFLDVTYSCQAGAEHFQQCPEFLPLRNRGLGPLAVTVLPLTRRAAATACAAVRWGSRERLSWRPAHADDPPPRVDYGTALSGRWFDQLRRQPRRRLSPRSCRPLLF
jgi:hypothetical protein